MQGIDTTDIPVADGARAEVDVPERWPEVAPGVDNAMKPARGAFIGITIGCAVWVILLLGLAAVFSR
jgi:hypothetical protein